MLPAYYLLEIYIWQDLKIKGPKKRSFEILHCLRWERNSFKNVGRIKSFFPIVLTLQKKSVFLSDLQNIIFLLRASKGAGVLVGVISAI